GRLGAAYAGLVLLEQGVRWPSETVYERNVLAAHLTPVARVEAGQRLAPLVHAMTDVSDGLIVELKALTSFGGIGATIWGEQLPIDWATEKVAARFRQNPLDYALYGGEDYELLMAVPSSQAEEAQRLCMQCGVAITEIGVISDRLGITLNVQGQEVAIDDKGVFDHFAVDVPQRQS
ncbi:MAG: AIR synthase-related protein, partial [Firmicutes bacterium]|nr:AIR synthase-related protein [Bacillota bacterium]